MGPKVGLDECGNSRLHRDSISGLSSPWRVAIMTTLPRLSCDSAAADNDNDDDDNNNNNNNNNNNKKTTLPPPPKNDDDEVLHALGCCMMHE